MNILVVAPLAAWFIAQLIKFAAAAFRGDVDFRLFWQSGGMPSSHTSIVVALATATGVVAGGSSPAFAVAFILALIVVYDATGVRQSVQMMSPVLTELAQRDDIEVNKKLLLIRGHTNKEVIYGIINGMVVALLFTTSYWAGELEWLTHLAIGVELYAQYGALLVLAVAGIGLYTLSNKGSNAKLPSYSRLRRLAIGWLIMPAAIGGLFLLARSETITFFSWRLWPWLAVAIAVSAQIVLSQSVYRGFKERAAAERQHFVERKKQTKARKKQVKKRQKKSKRKR